MKQYLTIFLIALFAASCNSDQIETTETNITDKKTEGRTYFDFDEVLHYSSDILQQELELEY